MDIDLVAGIAPNQAARIVTALGPDWYADPEQIRDSLVRGRAFNLIHIPTSQKVDIFPATDPFHDAQMLRATREPLEIADEVAEYPVATAEDILLAKLQWFRDGGEISDRQWSDITGIVASNPGIDCGYLEAWAEHLGISGLLKRALAGA